MELRLHVFRGRHGRLPLRSTIGEELHPRRRSPCAYVRAYGPGAPTPHPAGIAVPKFLHTNRRAAAHRQAQLLGPPRCPERKIPVPPRRRRPIRLLPPPHARVRPRAPRKLPIRPQPPLPADRVRRHGRRGRPRETILVIPRHGRRGRNTGVKGPRRARACVRALPDLDPEPLPSALSWRATYAVGRLGLGRERGGWPCFDNWSFLRNSYLLTISRVSK
mmetsp:Transcript_7029/g.17258  ORF Transcript_7029/g.17258 Transcript_7029/m.17258 type:complete len:219 (-) Transcript_7029:5-661(-)